MATTVLIVDDQPNILSSLGTALELEGYRVLTASSGQAGLALVREQPLDIVLLDVAMPEMDGLAMLKRVRERLPELPVVMMSGHSSIEAAVAATKLGAFDFLEKPISTERLLIVIQNALRLSALSQENARLREGRDQDSKMIGDSAVMRHVWQTVKKTAPTQGRVLITGPNGTGKELVARAIHQLSTRAERPLIKINCAAIPDDLIESELFGHEKGAFTGATRLRKGKFELADGGTLFLDEIGDMSLSAQAKVLRALQEGEIERVGGSESIHVDVRVVAATNKNMADAIAKGNFREDLYYRLNVVPIDLPPLTKRREDIPALVRHMVDVAARLHGKRSVTVTEQAVSLLMQYEWPGNIRELRNIVERCVILSEGLLVTEETIEAMLPLANRARGVYKPGVSLKDLVAAAERDLIVAALHACGGQVAKAAAELQLERSHLYKKMRALGIERS